MEDTTLWVYLFAAIISLVITYHLIASAVSAGMRKTNDLLKKQNDILLKTLNEQGTDKDELNDIFLMEKKELWPSMKNKTQPL